MGIWNKIYHVAYKLYQVYFTPLFVVELWFSIQKKNTSLYD